MPSAIIVGSGPNGLAAALTLAAGGVDVTVLEASDSIGGGTRSGESTLPGLLHDQCSGFHPLAVDTGFSRQFDLESHGVRWALPEVQYSHPLDGGRGAAVWRSVDRTATHLGTDGDSYRRMFGPLTERFPDIVTEFLQPLLHVPGHPLSLARFGAYAALPATLLARRWESALLVNVDNDTLKRLLENEQALKALMSIEGFRNLNKDIEVIINRSEEVKKTKREMNDGTLSPAERKELNEKEKEYRNKRKMIQEKLIKFATRIPIFMYLTDFREHTLRDVITKLEPMLFKRVTGLDVKDFELLVSLNLFNSSLMNDAVFKFKRYEDSSLSYTGINRHAEDRVGLYDTVLSREEYEQIFVNEPADAESTYSE